MKKVFLSLLMAGSLLMASSMDSNAQTTRTVQGKAVSKGRGANPNIKKDAPTTDVMTKGTKTRGACSITVDNWTSLYVKVYVDGVYRGTVDAWGKGTVTVGDGYTTVYCVSVGGTREWNDSGSCTNTAVTYKLQ
ncbi:MAG: hypothetical protein EOP50_09650 [Sphingobacteriales bacterium]|nr:MAG: hypothetical protein EOP50_09650 [Sphingobacteriales bacterium]